MDKAVYAFLRDYGIEVTAELKKRIRKEYKFPPEDLINKYKEIGSIYYTVDYAELEDGSWRIIEAGDGSVSGLSPGQDYEVYYRVLYNCLSDL